MVSTIGLFPMDTIVINRGPRRIQLRRTVHDGLQSPPIWRRHGALSHPASDDSREQKRPGRQVRPFDPALWQDENEAIVLRGNLAKFSQNKDMRVALENTGARRIAEASPRDKCGASVGLHLTCVLPPVRRSVESTS